ncbi:MAG: tripartite tricarboxylate transporter substrate-binding protein [Pseudomonadota bacterium]
MQKTAKRTLILALLLPLLITFGALPVIAAENSAAEFYKGKTVEYVIPYGVGGGTDQLSRLIIPYLEKRLGCSIVPANKAGAGGLIGLNYLWNAKKNGLTMGTVMYDAAVWGEFVQSSAVKFEIDKLNLVGGMEKQALILLAGKDSPYKTFEDLTKTTKPALMGVPGKMSTMHVLMALATEVWGFPIKFISGYKGAAAFFKAAEGGEVDIVCGSEVSGGPRIKSGTVHPLVYLTQERESFFPDIPAVTETPPKNKAAFDQFISAIWIYRFARSVGMPPGVPADRLAFVREALKDTVKDPALLAEAKKKGITFLYTDPNEFKRQKAKLFGEMSAQDREHMKKLFK